MKIRFSALESLYIPGVRKESFLDEVSLEPGLESWKGFGDQPEERWSCGSVGNGHCRERQQQKHRNEKVCRMSGEHLGWLDGAQMYEREQKEIKLGK